MNWISSALDFGFLLLFLHVFYVIIQLVNIWLDDSISARMKE